MRFTKKVVFVPARALLLKSHEKHRIPMNSSKSTDFISSRDALAMLCHAPRARIPCKKYHAGTMRGSMRAHDQSDRFLEFLRARTSSSTPSSSWRSPSSSTDGHHHRHRRCNHRLRYRSCPRHLIIAAAVVIFMIVAVVVDVIMLSCPPKSPTRTEVLVRQRGP